MSPRLRTGLAAVIPITAALTLTGCSSKPAVCSDIDDLKKSAQSLKDVTIGQNTLPTIKSDLEQISQELDKLASDAKGQYSAEISQLKSALSLLSSSSSAAIADPNATTLAVIPVAVSGVVSASQNLASAVSKTC